MPSLSQAGKVKDEQTPILAVTSFRMTTLSTYNWAIPSPDPFPLMRIRKLDTDRRRDIREFICFPLHLHKNNPYFCSALEPEARFPLNLEKRFLDPHSATDIFLAASEELVI
jgi:hypothetical protein